MSQRWGPAGALLMVLILLGVWQTVPVISVSQPSTAPRVAAPAPAPSLPDTLRSTTTGTPLIRSLPAELNGAAVSRYLILDGPALSGVAGRSFTWIPKGTDPDTVDVRLQARHPDAPADTLVLQIDVQP
jgi:hypothetical protein